MKDKSTDVLILAVVGVMFALWIATVGSVGFVVLHFVLKFW